VPVVASRNAAHALCGKHSENVMYVVIFKAKVKALDADYAATAERLRTLALEQFNCIAFEAFSENGNEVALSYWHSEADIRAWKQHLPHLDAQQAGRSRWYSAYTVEVARIERRYESR
jgi:heme-degrading monooxygenase HmoA